MGYIMLLFIPFWYWISWKSHFKQILFWGTVK